MPGKKSEGEVVEKYQGNLSKKTNGLHITISALPAFEIRMSTPENTDHISVNSFKRVDSTERRLYTGTTSGFILNHNSY